MKWRSRIAWALSVAAGLAPFGGHAAEGRAPAPRLDALLRMIAEERLAEAERTLRVEIERGGAPPLAHALLGQVLALGSRYDEAALELEQALTDRPDRAGWWRELAAVEAERGRAQQALRALDRVIALAPSAAAYHDRALCHLELGEPEAARKELERALELDAESLPALTKAGELALDRGEPAAARDLLARAVALDPEEVGASILLAQAELELGEAEVARVRLAAVLRVVPRSATALYLLARARRELGDETGASEALAHYAEASADQERLERALQSARLDPRSAAARVEAGRWLIQAGRFAEARSELEAARRLAPLAEPYRRWLERPPTVTLEIEEGAP